VGSHPTITPHSTILRERIAKTRINAIALTFWVSRRGLPLQKVQEANLGLLR
jgi:hypothetical protein